MLLIILQRRNYSEALSSKRETKLFQLSKGKEKQVKIHTKDAINLVVSKWGKE